MVDAQPLALIVEDDLSTAEMFAEMLKISGYASERAANGLDALDLLMDHRPDVILLDLIMPGSSGLDFLAAFRSKELENKPPVIVVSSKGSPLDSRELAEVGAQAYLAKPVSFQELQWVVSKVLKTGVG